jgi:hypothetical protein
MNKKRLIAGIVLCILILIPVSYWYLGDVLKNADERAAGITDKADKVRPAAPINSSLTHSDSSIVGSRSSEEAKRSFVAAYAAPISFYGKVIDESGEPIEGAFVKLIAADSPVANGTEYERLSDNHGLFSITGARGAGIVVYISKSGYHSTKQSQGRYVYGGVRSNADPENPTNNTPALFVLKKKGEVASLVKLKTGSVMLSRNGNTTRLSLRRERAKLLPDAPEGDIQIELWSDYTEGMREYNWRCRIVVPGGGLIERGDAYAFEAPATGYKPVFEFDMSTSADRWRPHLEKAFFLRLADGVFARVSLNIITGDNHFIVIESYLNPESKNRNLEFDSAKAIKPAP